MSLVEVEFVDVHPTEPWILIVRWKKSIVIWNYNTQEMARLPASREQREVSNRNDDSIAPLTAKFVAPKMWIVVGCTSGYIKVYSCCKQSLFSEIKSFKAHEYGDIWSLELHQTGPYMLSAVNQGQRQSSSWDNPMDKIKLWDWENDWKLVCTFNTEMHTSLVKFDPKDVNMFATISGGRIKVWNTGSPDSVSEFSGMRHAWRFDFFSRDGTLYMIIVEESNRRKATIWDYQKMKCVKTLKGHMGWVNVVFSHPEIPVLITGSSDGTICLWNSSTFSLLGVLNCDLGQVMAIASLKGSRRIATLHRDALAIAEIDSDGIRHTI